MSSSTLLTQVCGRREVVQVDQHQSASPGVNCCAARKPLSSAAVAAVAAGEVLSAQVIGTCALYAAQSMLVFGFAAAAVELAFANGLVKRMRGSSTK